MSFSTISNPFETSPVAELFAASQIIDTISAFQSNPVTPASTHTFEVQLEDHLSEIGRRVMELILNDLEAKDSERATPFLEFEGNIYRQREQSPRRAGVGTRFGIINLTRTRYAPCDEGIGLKSIFPLEIQLGIVCEKATPALADRLGQWTAQHTQETVHRLLQEEHNVSWSTETVRNIVSELSQSLAPLTHQAQVDHLRKFLGEANDSKGPHRPVLTVGRDGIFVPLRNDTKYREASTATVAILDRNGRRLTTVYLGHMPEPGQGTLSQQMTELLTDLFKDWEGPMPRLQYVTDGGHHPTEYFAKVLKLMVHPRTGKLLEWEWVIDYYHACLYITKLADVLFGKETKESASWAAKMRRWLKDKKGGIHRVIHSAAAHASRLEFTPEEQKAYAEAREYLRSRSHEMNYFSCRQRGLAIGSGITEAACKTLFTQRFKQSGMKWSLDGGQVVVDLRVIWISKLWHSVFATYLKTPIAILKGTNVRDSKNSSRIPA